MARLADAVAGAPILASWHNTNRDHTIVPFTGTTERNSQIPVPVLGMACYLDTPDVFQIYNGSAWVTVTPVATKITSSEATTSASYVDLATAGPSVTLETGTKALVRLTIGVSPSAANIAFASFTISGATSSAALDTHAVVSASTGGVGWPDRVGAETYLTTLTAGTNTFKMQYKVSSGTTNFLDRVISVVGIP